MEIEHGTATGHRQRQICRLTIIHTTQEHSHSPGTHLVVGDGTSSIARHDPVDLITRQGLTIALLCDQVHHAHGLLHRV